jgi:hypothetical protein
LAAFVYFISVFVYFLQLRGREIGYAGGKSKEESWVKVVLLKELSK